MPQTVGLPGAGHGRDQQIGFAQTGLSIGWLYLEDVHLTRYDLASIPDLGLTV